MEIQQSWRLISGTASVAVFQILLRDIRRLVPRIKGQKKQSTMRTLQMMGWRWILVLIRFYSLGWRKQENVSSMQYLMLSHQWNTCRLIQIRLEILRLILVMCFDLRVVMQMKTNNLQLHPFTRKSMENRLWNVLERIQDWQQPRAKMIRTSQVLLILLERQSWVYTLSLMHWHWM